MRRYGVRNESFLVHAGLCTRDAHALYSQTRDGVSCVFTNPLTWCIHRLLTLLAVWPVSCSAVIQVFTNALSVLPASVLSASGVADECLVLTTLNSPLFACLSDLALIEGCCSQNCYESLYATMTDPVVSTNSYVTSG